MRRVAMFTGLLLAAMLLGGFVLCDAQQPGTLVVQPDLVNGCLTMLNNVQALKRTGLCSFTVIAEGAKLPDLECHVALSGYINSALVDTIIDCTYSPIKKLVANPNTPNVKAGTIILSGNDVALGSDGCLAMLNNPGWKLEGKCGFSVNMQLTAVRSASFTVKVGGGNTTLDVTYVPIKPQAAMPTTMTTAAAQ